MDDVKRGPERPQPQTPRQLAEDLAADLAGVADELIRDVEPVVEYRVLDRWPTGSRDAPAS